MKLRKIKCFSTVDVLKKEKKMNLIFVKFQFRAWPIFACGVIFDKPD